MKKTTKKTMMFAMLTMLGAMFLLPAVAQAAPPDWYVCNIVQVGPAGSGSNIFIRLAEGGGSWTKWFSARSGRENQTLAIALTAMANEMKVRVFINNIDIDKSEITAIYLLPH